MKKLSTPQKSLRMMTVVLVLALIPFAVTIFDKKMGPQRRIASEDMADYQLHADHDLSEVSAEDFKKAYKYQILKGVNIVVDNDTTGLQLGLFLLKNAAGERVSVCEEYPLMDMIYSAEGIAFSGDIPQMIVRGPCLVDDDQIHIAALPIPFAQIFSSPLTQYQFTVPLAQTSEAASIYFRNVVEFWPRQWVWTGVKFYGKDPANTLSITGYEVISVLGKPVTIDHSLNE
ncbi:MAG: hypothetical protein AAGB31_03565 [Bdellovibrio sp.]